MIRITKAILSVYLIAFFAADALAVNDKAGTTAAKFLNIGIGSRALALGSAYSSINGELSSVYWNPAGIHSIKESQALFMYSQWLSQADYANIIAAYPMENIGTLGIMVNYLKIAPIEGLDEYGFATGTNYEPSDMAITLSWAKKRTSLICPGINLKYISSKLTDDVSGSAIAFDIGNQSSFMLFGKDISAGIVIKNIGTKIELNSKYSLPVNLSLGFSTMLKDSLLATCEITMPFDDDMELAIGAEYTKQTTLLLAAVRAGYRTGSEGLNSLAGLGAGAGITWKKYSFDYSWSPYGDLGTNHTVSLSYRF